MRRDPAEKGGQQVNLKAKDVHGKEVAPFREALIYSEF